MIYKLRLVAILLATLSAPIMRAQHTLSGTVRTVDNVPLSGAHVSIDGLLRSTYTDGEGQFAITGLRQGKYVVRTSYLGYATHTDTLSLPGTVLNLLLRTSPFMAGEVVVEATRLSQNAPGTFQNIDREELSRLNLAQDFAFLVHWTPSMVVTSDAGAGVGYTSMRIRGSDQSRINVTVNGIPMNDSESQGVFWVNMPDLASSMQSVQIQRGLGTSTNGSGAFGASVNIETGNPVGDAGFELGSTFGSFNTRRHNLLFHTGRLGKGFWLEGRLSAINSDGYVDRASSDLRSYYLSGGYSGERTMLKAVHFSGRERTYQSWYGTPQSRIQNDVEGMIAHAEREGYSDAQIDNLLGSGRTFNFYLYDNEVDDYGQDHYQLHLIHALSDATTLAASLHYTYGRGFFEQFRENDRYSRYGLPNVVIGDTSISRTDFIRRRWLDNHFYGGTYSLQHRHGAHLLTLGGGVHIYRGDHYGEIVWARIAEGIAPFQRYYYNFGNKDEYNSFLKWEFNRGPWSLLADAQVRLVGYQTAGADNNQRPFDIDEQFNFLNPKAGVRYALNQSQAIYIYAGRGHREPVRRDFVDAAEGQEVKPEILNNVELGYTFRSDRWNATINGYYMGYKDQLVPTGELNDVGASIRRNVDRSYRIGVESEVYYSLSPKVLLNANLTLSRNRIRNFTEILYDDTDGFEIVERSYENTDISFSPKVVGAGRLIWYPIKRGEVNLIYKYVGIQYLDNTSNSARSLDAYGTTDMRLAYQIEGGAFKALAFQLMVNNITNALYSSNGYTYSYIAGQDVTENFFYPQAGIHFLAGVNIKL